MLKKYITGYVLSLACTLLAFHLVQQHIASGHSFPSHSSMLWYFSALAVAQLTAQLVFFLHFGSESKPWDKVVLAFAVFIVVTVIGGTFWIMNNLQHNQMQVPFVNGDISPQAEK